MHIHTVYFWLHDNLDQSQLEKFEQGLKSLLTISYVQEAYWGKPAGTPREVVDNSYQVDDVHNMFVTTNKHKWKRVQVYDVLTH
jgi:hypothetical protein